MPLNRILTRRALKIPVFTLCLVPTLLLGWKALNGDLGANPIEFITHATGDWTIRFLCITLSITPLRKLLRLPDLIRFRRMLGLFGFFYGCLHFLTWLVLDKFFAWDEILKDVVKRPFITAGFTAFVLLIPLAVTSTKGWIRRMGGKRWQALHRLIYVSACAGVVHYYWLVKSDIRLPVLYGSIVAVLLGYRLIVNLRKGRKPLPRVGDRHPGRRAGIAPVSLAVSTTLVK
jgi:sulfoxide reductase heme-binding subunit YedZ